MTGPWQALEQLFGDLGILLLALLEFVLKWSLVIVWLALALWAMDWRKVWPVLGRGAWVALVLIMGLVALVWSKLSPSPVANFWLQLGLVALGVAITFLCGWLQQALGWTPLQVELEPPADVHAHAHH